ncbi:endonuclease G, mitochondrial-like [Lingula anatina]|uniref:Endonuclease n=1 Tax=Lingula anatina TaxID=7574 RepID=A0A1S3JI86_LINAN|nr:endonuclease G, mitochondrial-like [Lingula anatina]|eukprot:XP_013410102.1 endonuclease G, mitochondrial-like [Lingula anatina]
MSKIRWATVASSLSCLGIGSFLGKIYGTRCHDSCASCNGPLHYFSLPVAEAKVNTELQVPVTPIRQEISAKGDAPTGNNRVSQIMRFGFPGLDNVRTLKDYVISYDRRNRTANWVFEHLTPENVAYNEYVDRKHCEFFEDESFHPYHRARNEDYKGSGYDRGHLAAAANHRSSLQAMGETFLLSNISPQVGKGFNRDAWNKLENYVRKLTKNHPNVYVCTGPLYLPRKEPDGKTYVKYEVIGKNNVAVPTHFFKVIVMENEKGDFHLQSFVMPNQALPDNINLFNYQVPVDSIERAAGLLMFEKLPRNRLKYINGKKI